MHCCHNVCSSHLLSLLSRPFTVYRNVNLFPFQPPETTVTIAPFWPFRTGFKIDSLNANCYCIETLPHFGCQATLSLDYLLLPPRSVLMHHPHRITPCLLPITLIVHHTYLQDGSLFFLFSSLHLLFICLYTFSAIHFQGYCICPVSCYTLLSRFQLPWPLSGCPNATTLFDGI